MNTKSAARSGFVRPRALLALLLLAAAVHLMIGGRLPDTAKVSDRTLTFEERVAYQRAIEEVYWRHRIWPKESHDPKPSLDAIMSQADLEKKVTDYLRNSQALEDYWQRPLTPEQLQAEMERMAKHTKQPEVLRELFEALGEDPFVIAECLARPALAERLLTNWYAYDQTIHGELKQRAEAELQTHRTVEQMKQLSGKYTEIEFVKSDGAKQENSHSPEHAVKLTSREWDEIVQKLAAMFGSVSAADKTSRKGGLQSAPAEACKIVSVGTLSPLQEDETRFYATVVIQKSEDRLKLANVSWLKEPLENWLTRAESQVAKPVAVRTGSYSLPEISGNGCVDDTWIATAGPPDARSGHTAVWTGSEMIIWGGERDTGGKYSPATDSWTATSRVNAPTARSHHTAVWTGSEMIVWGGVDEDYLFLNTGGRFDPGTNSWTPTSTINSPSGRADHTAVWTGNGMIVWGGYFYDGNDHYLNTGDRYDPGTDSWTATSTVSPPDGRDEHTGVWTGSEMIVWGGYNDFGGLNTGGRYNPKTDSWTATSTANAPAPRYIHTAVWTGIGMIVWGGLESGNYLNTGGRYNPNTDSWIPTATSNAPSARYNHTVVWTGSEMIIWGGENSDPLNSGGRYNPNTNSWTATSIANAPTDRASHTAVWTGSEMIVWGGSGDFENLNNGGRYNPSINSWTNTGSNNVPSGRAYHTAVWTGSEMIVWGGVDASYDDLNSGSKYDPSTDTWTLTSTTNVPDGRRWHTAVWSGNEMIIWGGHNFPVGDLSTGGRYNPATNSWTATSTTNAPPARSGHTAVWTGSEMIVWGGDNAYALNTGGRYDPSSNSWANTSTNNAPSGRVAYTAVWAGSEMIIWGGQDDSSNYLNTGGRYNPNTDSWTATSITNAPGARVGHTAVWTDSEMVVWGGENNGTIFNTGGRYNPGTNSWSSTSTMNVPESREGHTAVWTGSEMIVWGGGYLDELGIGGIYKNTGGRYNPDTNSWTATSTANAPDSRADHTAVWTGTEMIVWGGFPSYLNTGGTYCAQSGPSPTPTPTPTASPTPTATPTPTPTPTPCTGRCAPTPRPRPTRAPRP